MALPNEEKTRKREGCRRERKVNPLVLGRI